jgi:hypothetical protein
MEARRALLIFRLVFYPAAIALAVVLLTARGGDAEAEVVSRWGVTDQDEAMHFELDGRGRAERFQTSVTAWCPDGGSFPMTWFPGDGAPVPFEQRGDRLHVREPGRKRYDDGSIAEWVLTMDARIGDDRVTGTMDVHVRYDSGYECSASGVRFSAR